MEKDHTPSVIKAALQAKCPRCREGNMFIGKTYALKAQKMNETCPHCGLRYEREPGYFYVAMFVSYALAMAEMIVACVGFYLFTGYMEGPWPYLIATIGTVIVLSPLNYRYSRVVLLYWLTPGLSYQPEAKQVTEKP
ncbi:DUF983 domain-containing protein [Parapedobacter sp.]